jgi:hypothetical protein
MAVTFLKLKRTEGSASVVDPDPDRVGSTSFCRIGIGIQGMLIRIRPIQANEKDEKLNFFPQNLSMLSKLLKMMTHLKTDEKEKAL